MSGNFAPPSPGLEGSWSVVSKSLNTLYTNNLTKVIFVSVSVYGASTPPFGLDCALKVAGVPIQTVTVDYSTERYTHLFSFAVPAGATYRIDHLTPLNPNVLWAEFY